MTLRTTYRRSALVLAAILILAVGSALADWSSPRSWNEPRTFQRFSLSLDGGFGLADGHHGILDAKTEFQLGLSRRIRIGLGVGYLSGGNGWGRNGGYGLRPDEGTVQETNGDEHDKGFREMGPGQNYRVVPLSLNLYYLLPLSRRWNLFASGGGSFYWGWFHGSDIREQKTTWGGQGGIGAEYRLSRRLTLIAQGEYRFAEFNKLAKLAAGTSSTTCAADQKDGGHEMQLFSRVLLNGATFHLGAKFGF